MKKLLQNPFLKKTCSNCLILIFSFITATNCYSQFSFNVEGPIIITGSAYDITVGNFNNAGRLEAIVTHAQNYNSTTPSSSNIVTYIKYNTGSLVWESSIIENTGGYASQAITSGDYDSDGNRDFAFSSYCNCGNYYLYQGNGADGFTNVTPTFSGNRFSFDMITGDLNNDGKTDIVTGGNTMLSKFLNTSTGANNFSFNKASFIIPSSDNSSYGYSLADFNGDGFNDIVATVPGEAKVRVLLNDGAGGFNSTVYTDYNITGTSMSNIRGVATGDFNDDGYPDIVAASYNGNAIGVLINSADGLGLFNPVVLYSVTTPQWLEVGDLNIDGYLDIAVVTNNNISLFSGNGDGTFASTPYVYALTLARRLAIADMNNDGRNDIAAINSNSFTVLINKTGSFRKITDDVCYGGSYTFPDGTTQNNITTQVIQISNLISVVNSLDSIIQTTVNVNPIYNLTETDYVCSGESYTFPDGNTQNNITAQVIHASNLLTAGGMCDSIITTTVNVNPTYNLTETGYVCPGENYTFPDGNTQNNITAQVIYTSNLQTVASLCDSIIVTTVNVNPVYNLTETDAVCSGGSYTFPDGTTQNNITAQVIHTSNLQTVASLCDSIIVTTVNVNPTYNYTETDYVCSGASYTFPDGTTQNNITSQVIHTSNLLTVGSMCDSIITTTVNVNPTYNLTETGYVCPGENYTFPDGNTQNNITSQVIHTSNLLTAGSMCDSIITTTVNVNPTYNLTETGYVCSGASYTFPDGTTQNNIMAQVLHTSNLLTVGSMCDSIITTTVNVNPIYNLTETDYVCSGASYTFPDGTTQNNITAQVLHTSNLLTVGSMCDSIITTTVNVNPIYNLTETDSVCSGESYTFPDGTTQNNITAQVIHSSNFQSAGTLCDSIIVTTINVTEVVTSVSVSGFTITAGAMAASYQWLDCDNGYSEIIGEVSQSFTPAINGNYAVEVSQNSCVDTSACTLISGLGIKENGFNLKTRLYPNPTEGIVTVVFDKEYSDIHIAIKDVTGRVLGMGNYINAKMISINLQQTTGVYFIEISTESEKAVFKILKI